MLRVRTVANEPALTWITALTAAAGIAVRLAHLSGGWASLVSIAAIAAGTIITAAQARPVNVAVISGASGTVLVALADVGLHLSSQDISIATAAVGLFTGMVVRGHLTPVARLAPGGEDGPVVVSGG